MPACGAHTRTAVSARAAAIRSPASTRGTIRPPCSIPRSCRGDRVRVTVLPKGFGSENMSKLSMLTPAAGKEGIVNAVVSAVRDAGSRPCPPVIVGVGVGGTFDKCAYLAKKALLRPVGAPAERADVRELEERALSAVNALQIGAQGFGGDITALSVAIEVLPTHIAGLPVAVNMQCHCARCEEEIL